MGTTYEQLLDMAKEAELEFSESRGVTTRMKSVGVVEKADASKLQELNNRIDNLTMTLKANNLKPKSASAPNSPAKKQNDNGNQSLQSKGPEITSHGPFRGGEKPIQCYKCGGWGHGWCECPSPGNIDWRRLKGDTLPPASKEPLISRFHNLDPLIRLIGEPNETYANVEGSQTKVLLDSGAQLSSITSSKARELGLKVRHLQTILDLEATGGGDVPYEGYVELNLDIPEVAKFKEDVLMLVVKDSPYCEKVPVAIGTLHIDMVLDVAMKGELENIRRKWQQGSLG